MVALEVFNSILVMITVALGTVAPCDCVSVPAILQYAPPCPNNASWLAHSDTISHKIDFLTVGDLTHLTMRNYLLRHEYF